MAALRPHGYDDIGRHIGRRLTDLYWITLPGIVQIVNNPQYRNEKANTIGKPDDSVTEGVEENDEDTNADNEGERLDAGILPFPFQQSCVV